MWNNPVATGSWGSWKKIAYAEDVLPLSGGTLTGAITRAGNFVKNVNDTSVVTFYGGTDNNSASINLYGKSNANAGKFEIKASDGTNTKYLSGLPNGTLTWGGNNIALSKDVLSLTGGTLTGFLKLENNVVAEQITTLEKGTNPSSVIYPFWCTCYDKNGTATANRICGIGGAIGTNGNIEMGLHAYKWVNGSTSSASVYVSSPLTGDPCFRPASDNNINLGQSITRWKQLYAGTTTISTSDERLKDNIEAIPDEVLDAWGEVNWYQYQFKDSIAEKGEKARIHTGAIAQRIESVFESHGLDANRYGLLCYDEWDAIEEQKDEDGNIINPAQPAGNRYSLRYEEALCMEAAYQRRRADRLEERIARLEALLTNTETEVE